MKNKVNYRKSHVLHNGVDYHDGFVRGYRASLWRFEKKILNNIIGEYCGKNSRLLDFACGTGRVLSEIESNFSESYGVDVSDNMLSSCEKNTRVSSLVNLDITKNADYFDFKFDVITAFRFFPGAEDELQSDVMIRLAELLSPNGILIFNNHRNYRGLFFVFQRYIYKLTKREWKVRCMREERAFFLAQQAGLEIKKIYFWGVIPSNEGKDMVPERILDLFEGWFSKVPFLRKFCASHIYVCVKPY